MIWELRRPGQHSRLSFLGQPSRRMRELEVEGPTNLGQHEDHRMLDHGLACSVRSQYWYWDLWKILL